MKHNLKIKIGLIVLLLVIPGCDFDDADRDDDRGDDDEVVTEKVVSKKQSKKLEEKRAESIRGFLKKLKHKDSKQRENAAEILGISNYPEAVPELIKALEDGNLFVALKAHGALNKITGKNFGNKNTEKWAAWWKGVEKDYVKNHREKTKVKRNESAGFLMR